MTNLTTSIETHEPPHTERNARRTPHRARRSAPRKRMLRKDIRVTLAKSKGRFLSIVSLMALGSFALVGLFATGPDMQATGRAFYAEHNLADVTVMSDYGLTEDDEAIIRDTAGVRQAEFGYSRT
ncbi:hypothetical protein [Bifidobacterium samirii]|uniref:Cell division protein FtsX n=1 Tax=Bifidobacterium samirii TaxID=2306974 RepID=A0A430FJA6_9BIFI|nr:hypothetical protein [Bifidobacterium samirii]RSX52975.1 cell division protein FtsX [Bifidobacterium samirii]